VRRSDGTLSAPAAWLIAGLVRMGGALMAFGNRDDGSFVRLAQAREAPRAIVWGDCDRDALVRLPIVARTGEGRAVSPSTVEFRLPDGSAHAHLLLAGVAQAMIHGRDTPDLDRLLASASAASPAARAGDATPVPAKRAEVGRALASHRAAFEAGGVFPPALIQEVLERLTG
jgi:glutamine synthetase